MKITAKLAYSQLKINRSRTIWTLLAIALSTALTTTVCSFVASGNAMLVNFLGEDYGVYGSAYITLLLIPAVIFGVLIVAMSVTVISNVFRISAQERVMQFGIMKCTGATQKQILDTVMYESIWLCVIGIPVGICVGTLLFFCGIGVINQSLADLSALAHMMIKEIDLSLHFVFSWQALLVSSFLSFLIVMYSAWRPAHKAARISAIECIHGAGEIKVEKKQLRENKLVRKCFGFEGVLADKNLKRNRKNFRATVVSLSVGVILFVSLGGLSSQADALEACMDLDLDETVIADYASNYASEEEQERGIPYARPIDSKVGEAITQKLETYGNINIWGMGNDMDSYHTVLGEQEISDEMKSVYVSETGKNNEFPVEIVVLDQENYEKLCKKANVAVGSNILLNYYSYNDFGKKVELEPFTDDLKEIELMKLDGSTQKLPIDGKITEEEMPKELFYFNFNPVRIVVEQASVRGFSWYSAPDNMEDFMDYSNQVLAEAFPSEHNESYVEEGFSVRVYKVDEYVKVMNIAISLVSVFMYGFVVLLMLIGLTNVISTLSTNVFMRAKEFAVLKSVGMTPESLKRMLNYESILCSLKAFVYGLPVGIAVTILVNLPIRMMFPIPYSVPWVSILLCLLVVFFITLGTTRYAAHKLQNQNIIESIRAESGR